jgi:hypothetical protein
MAVGGFGTAFRRLPVPEGGTIHVVFNGAGRLSGIPIPSIGE